MLRHRALISLALLCFSLSPVAYAPPAPLNPVCVRNLRMAGVSARAAVEVLQELLGGLRKIPPDVIEKMAASQKHSDIDEDFFLAARVGLQNLRFGRTDERTARQLDEGEAVTRVFVVTHQTEDLQARTAEVLAQHEGPVVLLASGDYPLTSGKLQDQASAVRYSTGGQTTLRLNTQEIHLAGGYCQHCLAETTAQLVHQLRSAPSLPLRLYIHTSVSYVDEPGKENGIPLSQKISSLGQGESTAYLQKLAADLVSFPKEAGKLTAAPVEKTSGQPTRVFRLTHSGAGNRVVEIHFVD